MRDTIFRRLGDALARQRATLLAGILFTQLRRFLVNMNLLDAQNTALTPHIGSATHKSRDDMARLVARNVNGVLDGTGAVTPLH